MHSRTTSLAKEGLSAAHQELLRRRLARLRKAEPSLSFAQERFWFLDQLDPDSSEYHITVLLKVEGALDTVALAGALGQLGQRHAALRTTFPSRSGAPDAVVADEPPNVRHIFAGTQSLEPSVDLPDFCREFHRQPFDLAQGPLWRVAHVALGQERSALVICLHHMITDGWSIGLLARDLSGLYNAKRGGTLVADLPRGATYAELASSQRKALTGPRLEEQVSHWREVLDGAPDAVALPTDRPAPPMVQSRGATASFRFNDAQVAAASKVMDNLGATPYQLFLSLFAGFLGRMGSTEDLVIGTSYAGRDRTGSHTVAGAFVNTLPLRLRPKAESTLSDLFMETRAALREAVAHSELPFEKLVSELQPIRDARRTPLFNVFFELRVHHEIPAWEGLVVHDVEVDVGEAPFDLTLAVDPRGDRFGATLQYRTDLFDRETIDELWRSFSMFCSHTLGDMSAPLGQAPLVSPDFLRRQLTPAVPAPSFRSVVTYFEASCARGGARLAVQDESDSWTYRELDRLSTWLGVALGNWCHDATPGQPICVAFDRSRFSVLAALAVWKAGFAYVPLDMEDGSSRRSRILQAFDAPRLVASVESHTWSGGADTFALEPWLDLVRTGNQPTKRHSPHGRRVLRSSDLAFVIFTSGSTGQPKGVELTHGALGNHIAWTLAAFDFVPEDRFLLRTPLGFDASVWELVNPLAVGASIIAVGPKAGRNSLALLQVAKAESVTVMQTTPSILRAWLDESILDELREVHTVISGGDALTPELTKETLGRWRGAGLDTRLFNHYGPSEACIDSHWDEVLLRLDDDRIKARDSISVGRVVHGMGALVLDAGLEPLPPGATGELCLAGANLARGYLKDPGLTAARFVEREFAGRTTRIYRTGDRARLMRDGRYEILGREDGQVKIHGHRVELGEVQAELLALQGVRAAEVLAVESESGKVLVGFVLLDGASQDAEPLQAKLALRLPSYMCPSQLHVLESLPLSANEKVDRRRLMALASDRLKRLHISAGRLAEGDVEQYLAATLGKLLGTHEVHVDADFFAMGGHSLLATRLLARARTKYGVDLELKQFLSEPTLAALAVSIAQAANISSQEGGSSPSPSLPTRKAGAPIPLSRAQQRLWLQEQGAAPSARYNMAGAVDLRGKLDRVALERALGALVTRHEILRTTFHESTGPHAAVQVVGPVPETVLEILEATSSLGYGGRADADHTVLRRELLSIAMVPMELDRGPLARFLLLELGPDHFGLLLVIHHILGDGWSFGILASELSSLYSGDSELEPLPMQFADYAAVDAQLSLDQAQLAAWLANLAGSAALNHPLELPTIRPRPPVPSGAGDLITRGVPPAVAEAARVYAKQTGSSLHNTLLASFGALIYHLTQESDLVIGAVLAGRAQPEVQDLLGFLVTALPVRLQLDPSDSFEGVLAKTKEAMGFVQTHQAIGLDVLAEQLCGEAHRASGALPLFRIGFDVAHDQGQPLVMEGLEVAVVEAHTGYAKLDWNVLVREQPSGELIVEMEYATQLFDEATIGAWFDGWMQLLGSFLAAPHLALSKGNLMTAECKRVARKEGTGVPLPRATTRTCLAAIEAFAEVSPDAVALVQGDEKLTYSELLRAADCFGQCLIARSPDLPRASTIAVILPRGFDQVIALLGLWKCGHSYMALDPAEPKARNRQLVKTGRCALVISGDEAYGGELGLPWIDAKPGTQNMDLQVAHWAAPRPGDLAYLVPTSGTTGTPKCIEMEHGALQNQNRAAAATFGWSSRDVFLHRIPITFDAAILELLTPLSLGARVVLCNSDETRDPNAHVKLAKRSGATVLVGVASWLEALLGESGFNDLLSLRMLISGGEVIGAGFAAKLAERRGHRALQVFNSYGPAESCVQVTAHMVTPCDLDQPGPLTRIGKPLPGTNVFVLDRGGSLCSVGVEGELVIGGVQVARGYRGATRRQGASFREHSLERDHLDRMYWTGDRGMRLADGSLRFCGRLDREHKIGGRRTNLGEIEAVLLGHPEVVCAAVLLGEEEHLVAHLESRSPLTAAELATYCRDHLPRSLCPSLWRVHNSLPKLASGKVDLVMLAENLERNGDAAGVLQGELLVEAVEPGTNEKELRIVQLFEQQLGVTGLGRNSDYFGSGGNSLGAIELVATLREDLVIARNGLRLADFFRVSSPAKLAAWLESARDGDDAREQARTLAAMARDAELGENFALGDRPVGIRDAVFLTGATGFLGAFLVHELLSSPGLEVRCLVRANSPESARHRVEANLAQYGLQLPSAGRLVCFAGDLGQERFGLGPAEWQAAAAGVRAVLHNGAAVDFFRDYAALAGANVEGTREALRLAFEACAEFNLVSTIGVLARPNGAGKALSVDLPSWPDSLDECTPLASVMAHELGYEQTKWVAEALTEDASKRGLVTRVFRPGRIAASAGLVPGASAKDDFSGRFFLGCLELQMAPAIDASFDMTPVDLAARSIVQLAQLTSPAPAQSHHQGTWHLLHPDRAPYGVLFDAARSAGITVELVDLATWRASAGASERLAPIVAMLDALPDAEAGQRLAPDAALDSIDSTRTYAALEALGITAPKIDEAYGEAAVRFLQSQGMLAKEAGARYGVQRDRPGEENLHGPAL